MGIPKEALIAVGRQRFAIGENWEEYGFLMILVANEPDLHLAFALRTEKGLTLTDDLQVHLLQLSKLTVPVQNIRNASPLEQWASFLLHVEHLTLDEVQQGRF